MIEIASYKKTVASGRKIIQVKEKIKYRVWIKNGSSIKALNKIFQCRNNHGCIMWSFMASSALIATKQVPFRFVWLSSLHSSAQRLEKMFETVENNKH